MVDNGSTEGGEELPASEAPVLERGEARQLPVNGLVHEGVCAVVRDISGFLYTPPGESAAAADHPSLSAGFPHFRHRSHTFDGAMTRTTLWLGIAALAAALVAGATAGLVALALAKRAPTAAERGPIVTAVNSFIRNHASSGYHGSRVTKVWVSTKNRRWARADTLSPSASVGKASAILQLTRSKGWRVRNFGARDVQCIAEAPAAVKIDLFGDNSCSFEP
jgi:hypothetical protein